MQNAFHSRVEFIFRVIFLCRWFSDVIKMKSNQQIMLPFGLHKKLSSPNDILFPRLTLVCHLTNNVGLLAPESQFTHIWGSFCRWHPSVVSLCKQNPTNEQHCVHLEWVCVCVSECFFDTRIWTNGQLLFPGITTTTARRFKIKSQPSLWPLVFAKTLAHTHTGETKGAVGALSSVGWT